MYYFLGIDGGGTKTTAVIIDGDGAEHGRGTGGPGNVANNDDATLTDSLRAAIDQARAAARMPDRRPFARVCAGVAGWSVETRRNAFTTLLEATALAERTADEATTRCRVEPDFVTAYWGASRGTPGIVVIAGTGSVVYGRNDDGQAHREDGLGYLLGDRGSGFHLGLRALSHTLARMRAGEIDALTEAVVRETGARTQNEVLHWLYSAFNPEKVAALAPSIGALADEGDPAACSDLAAIARQLRICVRQTRYTLRLPRDVPIYPLGGLWRSGAFFRKEFADPRPHGEAPAGPDTSWLDTPFAIAVPAHEAAYGAALMARDDPPCSSTFPRADHFVSGVADVREPSVTRANVLHDGQMREAGR